MRGWKVDQGAGNQGVREPGQMPRLLLDGERPQASLARKSLWEP